MADRDVVVALGRCENLRPLFDRTDAKYRYLGLIDDRRAEQSAEYPGIRDRECSESYFIRIELLHPGTIGEIIRCECKAGKRKRVSLLYHRHDQSPIKSHRHSEIDVAFINDVVAIYLRVDYG